MSPGTTQNTTPVPARGAAPAKQWRRTAGGARGAGARSRRSRLPSPAGAAASVCAATLTLLLALTPAAQARDTALPDPRTAADTTRTTTERGAGRVSAPTAPTIGAILGGTALFSATGRCQVAFNALRGGDHTGVLGPACGPVGTSWNGPDGTAVGTTTSSRFPGGTHSLITYNDSHDHPAAFWNGSDAIGVTGVRSPVIGAPVCHFGSTEGLRCATITGVNLTVVLPEGVRSGLFSSSACSGPGDYGAPAFSGDRALGFVLASSGSCASGGGTYYQPIGPVLAADGLTLTY